MTFTQAKEMADRYRTMVECLIHVQALQTARVSSLRHTPFEPGQYAEDEERHERDAQTENVVL